jgi:mRNA-degrading endonuclease YafQ of YafQ-DinJ toxin-antitoxin module
VDNGGLLDRVHFISQVRFPEDAEFLTTIIESNPIRYTYRDFGMMGEFGDYSGLWDHDIEPDTIYVKIGPPLLTP